ncbi:hypothetical protein BHE74_00047075, partial [Ensete ventricosum]
HHSLLVWLKHIDISGSSPSIKKEEHEAFAEEDSDQGADELRQVPHQSHACRLLLQQKDQLVPVGDGVDPANITTTLRKKVGHACIVKVEEVKEEAKESAVVWCYPPCHKVVMYENHGTCASEPGVCSIL